MKALVFDASALLALLFDEPGAAAVEPLMQRAAEKEQALVPRLRPRSLGR